MKNDIDDLLGAVFGSRRSFSTDGKDLPTLEVPTSPAKPKTASRPPVSNSVKATGEKTADAAAKASFSALEGDASAAQAVGAVQQNVTEMSQLLDARLAQQQKEIEALNQNALEDIARIKREVSTPAVQNLATGAGEAVVTPGAAGAGAEGFDGLAPELGKTVFGQESYLKALVIALKRPYVMGRSGGAARNTMLLTGPRCTGKHLSLTAAAAALKERHVLASAEIAWIDLALYPTSAEEKLFLQDLYMALAGSAELLAFTHYESCYSGFLSVLGDLVQKGSHPLANRYVMQNGRLIDAGNALVQDAVSALTPRGKYLCFVTERPVSKLADSFGAPFVSTLGDTCETLPLTAPALTQIAAAQWEILKAHAAQNLQMQLSGSAEVNALAVNAARGDSGAQGLLDFWANAAKALAQFKLENEIPANLPVALCVENGALCADFGKGAQNLLALLPGAYTGAMEEVKAELCSIVGLKEIKEYILSLEDNYKIQARRKAEGLKASGVSMHMIFTGNPGTGKTTIARIVSKYLKAIGVLSGGQLVEVTRADLVGKYVGHTAPLTTQVMKSALGGVLFIDEAYSLYRGKDDSFGLEAIDTLVKGMEDNRDNLVVILAGYSKEMAEFLTANSGLKSRFPNIIEFPDYSGQELLDIIKIQAKSKGYRLDEACDPILLAYFNAVQLARARDAGNGRLARNKLEEAILNQSKRLVREPKADLSLLTTADFELNDVEKG